LKISFQNIVPVPLLERNTSNSEIWNKELELESDKKILVTAPSGSGKSTFSHILYGLRSDYQGNYLLDGVNSHTFAWQAWTGYRQHAISIMFQDLRLFSTLSALENLMLKASLTDGAYRDQIEQMASALHIADKLGQKVANLSIGERQRVALIRSLLQPFDWLILDEPFSNLDHDNITAAVALINQSCNKNEGGLIACQLHPDELFDYDLKLKL